MIKLTAYFGERERSGGRFLSEALLDLYARERVPSSVLLRGIAGFGAQHRITSADLLTPSEDLPLVAVAVDAPERVDALAPRVRELLRAGLVTLEHAGDAPWVELTIVTGRGDSYRELCMRLRECGLAGATVLAGVDGTVAGERRRARLLGGNREVPSLVVAVGDAEAARRARETLEPHFVTASPTTVCRRDGVTLAEPDPGAGAWHRLTLHSSDHAAHEELMLRLRAAETAGATTLAGVYGFHGDHEPHGDRLLQGRRGVPAVTVIVDAAAHVASTFRIVSELTPKRGLVTSEAVPVILE